MGMDIIARGMAASASEALANKADLVNGKVPEGQLPSYVDDVLEFADKAHFPSEGEQGKIYVALDTNLTYRWSGSAYIQIGGQDLSAYLLKNIVAPEFDNTATYWAGSYAFHDNVLYQALVDIDVPGEFNPAEWKSLTLTDPDCFVDAINEQNVPGTKHFTFVTASAINTGKILNSSVPVLSGSGLLIPDTTGWETSKTIATTDQTLDPANMPNASYILATGADNTNYLQFVTQASQGMGVLVKLNKYGQLLFDQIYNGNDVGTLFSIASSQLEHANNIRPNNDNSRTLGDSTHRYKNVFVSGTLTDGTNSVSIADLAALITYAKGQG